MGLHRWRNNDKAGVVGGVVVLELGAELIWDYSGWGTDCAAAKTYFDGLTLAQKLALPGVSRTMPSPPSGYYYKEEVCGGTTTPTTPADPGVPATYSTTITASNGGSFSPVVEWQGNKARIRDTASRSGNVRYWLNGQPAVGSLSTEYTYVPGDEVTIYTAVTSGDDNPYTSNFSQFADAVIRFGQPNT